MVTTKTKKKEKEKRRFLLDMRSKIVNMPSGVQSL